MNPKATHHSMSRLLKKAHTYEAYFFFNPIINSFNDWL